MLTAIQGKDKWPVGAQKSVRALMLELNFFSYSKRNAIHQSLFDDIMKKLQNFIDCEGWNPELYHKML